jgi:hypothetical protein
MSDDIITDRGFRHSPPVVGTYGEAAKVYESSAASGPEQLAANIMRICTLHYQREPNEELVAIGIARAQEFRRVCSEQWRGWLHDPEDQGRSDLWFGRQEGMSAFIDWLENGGSLP